MSWMTPLNRLDSAQRAVLTDCAAMTAERPKWIEGFAGSGKSILLVHAVENYVSTHPDGKVCIVVFTHALIDLLRSGIAPDLRDKIPVMTYLHFVNVDKNRYDLVVVDEVQDIPATILRIIRQRSTKLLVGGDDAQSIYPYGSRSEKIEEVLRPDRAMLTVTYRLTRKIMNVIKDILPGNNLVALVGERTNDVQVMLAHANSQELELTWVWNQAKKFTEIGFPSVVVLPGHISIQDFMRFVSQHENHLPPAFPLDRWNNPDYSVANSMFKSWEGICLQYLGNGYGALSDSDTMPVVYVMTY